MAAMDSSSSCGPQAKAHPPPPMAHAPTPIGVNSISLLPSRFICIFSTLSKVGRVGYALALWSGFSLPALGGRVSRLNGRWADERTVGKLNGTVGKLKH